MYTIVSVVIFIIIGIAWSKDSLLDFSIKVGLFAMAGWGLVASNAISLNL